KYGSGRQTEPRAVFLQHASFDPAFNRLREAFPFTGRRLNAFGQSQADEKVFFGRIADRVGGVFERLREIAFERIRIAPAMCAVEGMRVKAEAEIGLQAPVFEVMT